MLRLLVVFFFLIAVSACATSPGKFQYAKPKEAIVWPLPPDEPRYQLDGYLLGEINFEQKDRPGQFIIDALAWIVGLALGEDRERMLQRPQAGTYDAKNNRVYVTDSERNAIFVFDYQQGQLKTWLDAGNGASFKTPVGIAVDQFGDVFVADADLGYVVQLNEQGQFVRNIGEKLFKRPVGIAYDAAEREFYVADSAAHQIFVLNKAGNLARKIGQPGGEQGQLNAPTHVALAADKLYVSDTLNARIQVFTKTGKFLTTFGKRGIYLGDTPRPKGVAFDASGRVYVVESYYDYLLVYDAQGQRLLPMGGRGRAAGQFYQPAGVWVDTLGRVFVADMYNSRVAVVSYIGKSDSGEQNASSERTTQSTR